MRDLTSSRPVRVLVVDDDPLVRYAFRALLESMEDVTVVGEASSGQGAVAKIKDTEPDLVLMDVHMDNMNGLQATRALVHQRAGTRVLVISVLPEDPYALEALRAGAFGYLRKEDVAHHLHEAILAVARGETYLSPNVAPDLLRRLVQAQYGVTAPALTSKEAEVLRLLAQGNSNKEIAVTLGCTVRTVKAHVSRILDKLQVQDRTQAAILAVRLGLIGAPPAERPARREARGA
ncbi:MAG: response regulator transcription factor [Bacillota bacterium]